MRCGPGLAGAPLIARHALRPIRSASIGIFLWMNQWLTALRQRRMRLAWRGVNLSRSQCSNETNATCWWGRGMGLRGNLETIAADALARLEKEGQNQWHFSHTKGELLRGSQNPV